MYNGSEQFDPENVTKETMKVIRESITGYLEVLESIMIIPSDMDRKYGKQMEDGIEVAKELIRKLKKGDTSVFVLDVDD